MKRQVVLLLGAGSEALLGSRLAPLFELVGFPETVGPLSLAAALVRLEAPLVHIRMSGSWRDLACVAAAKACGARVLCQVQGELRGLLRLAARLADLVVVPSRVALETLRARAPATAAEVVPGGIEVQPYLRYNRAAPERDAPLRLIYVGPLAPGQGLPETIEALRLALGRGVYVRLVIAGSGREEARLRQQVRDCGLARDVTFVGEVAGDHKAQLLSQADAFVLAAYSGGLPYRLLEAMAAGVVPIVTPVGAVPEVMNGLECGLLVEPRDAQALADAMCELANDRVRVLRMSAACRARIAAAYSADRLAHDFSQLYQGLCAARSPRVA